MELKLALVLVNAIARPPRLLGAGGAVCVCVCVNPKPLTHISLHYNLCEDGTASLEVYAYILNEGRTWC